MRAQPFFIIANLEEVWVMANVFETDIAKIKTGYDAEVNVIAYKDKTFTGKSGQDFFHTGSPKPGNEGPCKSSQ